MEKSVFECMVCRGVLNLSGSPSGQYSGQPVDVPQNHKRALCDLTVADRLALYDHAVGVLNRQNEASSNEDLYVDLVSKLQKDEGNNEPKTHLELMAEMRDYKRRRQSYRAKNVHITKKSYTEVIREVINVHSEELTRQWKEDEQESTRSELSSHRRRLDEQRSASSESRHSHSRRHRSRERSQDRESKKKRKKRDRDSRSPDDHHHERKKKKKRKEGREKEK